MPDLVIRVGSRTAQGKRSNNEDCLVADRERHVYLVADGMGGQDHGELASKLAAQIIPRVVTDRLAGRHGGVDAIRRALQEAHQAIVHAGSRQNGNRRMGTTAVVAVQEEERVWVAGVGDSPAYLIRGGNVEQLTVDHTVADALARNGTLTADQARHSHLRNVLYKFLGCTEMKDDAEVRPFTPQGGDRLILASDGLSGFISHDDLRRGVTQFDDPQAWANQLVELALDRGSRDNVTCIVVAFGGE